MLTPAELYTIHREAMATGSDDVGEVSGNAVQNVCDTLRGPIESCFTRKQATLYRDSVIDKLSEPGLVSAATRSWFANRGIRA